MAVSEKDKEFILSMHRDVLKSAERARKEVLRLLTMVDKENRDEAVACADDILYYLNRITRDIEDEEEGLGFNDE